MSQKEDRSKNRVKARPGAAVPAPSSGATTSPERCCRSDEKVRAAASDRVCLTPVGCPQEPPAEASELARTPNPRTPYEVYREHLARLDEGDRAAELSRLGGEFGVGDGAVGAHETPTTLWEAAGTMAARSWVDEFGEPPLEPSDSDEGGAR
jgi:hypothetical protein